MPMFPTPRPAPANNSDAASPPQDGALGDSGHSVIPRLLLERLQGPEHGETQMTIIAKRPATFAAVKAEMLSMVPFAFRGMVKPYITDENVMRILKVALGEEQASSAA